MGWWDKHKEAAAKISGDIHSGKALRKAIRVVDYGIKYTHGYVPTASLQLNGILDSDGTKHTLIIGFYPEKYRYGKSSFDFKERVYHSREAESQLSNYLALLEGGNGTYFQILYDTDDDRYYTVFYSE